MKKRKPKTLPSKPSALIRLALADLAKVERSNRYTVDMTTVHEPRVRGNKCAVCFAGAVIAKSLNVDSDKEVWPENFDRGTRNKLWSLDCFRVGQVAEALEQWLKMSLPQHIKACRRVASYQRNPTKFKSDMKQLAADLQKAGL